MGGRLRQFHFWFFQGYGFSGNSMRRKDPPSSAHSPPPTTAEQQTSQAGTGCGLCEARPVDRPRCRDFAGRRQILSAGDTEAWSLAPAHPPAHLCARNRGLSSDLCSHPPGLSPGSCTSPPVQARTQHPELPSHLRSESLLQISGPTGWSMLPWRPAHLCWSRPCVNPRWGDGQDQGRFS